MPGGSLTCQGTQTCSVAMSSPWSSKPQGARRHLSAAGHHHLAASKMLGRTQNCSSLEQVGGQGKLPKGRIRTAAADRFSEVSVSLGKGMRVSGTEGARGALAKNPCYPGAIDIRPGVARGPRRSAQQASIFALATGTNRRSWRLPTRLVLTMRASICSC